jgi:hypothetical protein
MVDGVEQVDTLSYGYRIPRLENSLAIQKEVYPVYPLFPEVQTKPVQQLVGVVGVVGIFPLC